MKATATRIAIGAALAVGCAALVAAQSPAPQRGGGRGGGAPPPMKLTSPSFTDLGTTMPEKHTCADQAKAVSPALQWSDAPKETASFAIIVHDPDGHPGGGIMDSLHWMVWNIPADVSQLPEGVPPTPEMPNGMRQSTPRPDTPTNVGYRCMGAQAAAPHHYTFEIFALDQKLDVPTGASRADLQKAMDGHIIGHGILVGLFHR